MSLAARVAELLSKGFLDPISRRCYFVTDSKIHIAEASKKGAAHVTLELPAACECLVLELEKGRVAGKPDPDWFKFLANEKCADGAFLVPAGLHAYDAHVVECKATVRSDNWPDIKLQLSGTLARLRALAGVLQVQLAQVYCYTAYRKDELTEALKADPAELRPEVGMSIHTAELLDWGLDKADLGCCGMFPHRRILLTLGEDSIGRATVPLARALTAL